MYADDHFSADRCYTFQGIGF